MSGFPSAHQIATAIVAACQATGEDPIACARGRGGVRARHVAMDGLMVAFPQARRVGLARCCGYPAPRSAHGQVIGARKLKWWRELFVDEVVGALVAETYGDQGR